MSYIGSEFYQNIAFGRYSNISPWSKIGFNPQVQTTEEDVWSAGGVYVFCTTAGIWEVVSSDNTQDIGTVIHSGGATGAGGSTTTISVAGENFLTTTAAGDHLIIDKGETTPEWAIITEVTSDTVLTFANGLSSGGTGASRSTYHVIDKSDKTHAQAVCICGLDSNYAEISEIVILNGTTAVDTTKNFFRVNGFRVICAGTSETSLGNLTLRADGAGATYSYITAGFTRARNSAYTVPASKTLYVNFLEAGATTPNDSKVQTCRIYTRANVEPKTLFRTDALFYNYTGLLVSNGQEGHEILIPTRLPAKTDIKMSAVGLTGFSGSVVTVLRGFLVS